MSYIEIIGIKKTIKNKEIIRNANLNFERGKAYGLVGANGSGKTMIMKIILGLVTPDQGDVYIDNKLITPGRPFPIDVGVIIENNGLWPELDAFENLKLLASINGRIGDSEIISSIKRVGLEANSKKIFSKFSLGMKQRLILAQAIMEKPQILLLDEPTNSLDEEGISTLKKILVEEKERGCTIIISSHSPEQFEEIWDEIIQVDKGIFSQSKMG